MAMTPFEKALLDELKGIRKELVKLNKADSDMPTANELLAMQMAQMQQTLKKSKQPEKTKDTIYDPLSKR